MNQRKIIVWGLILVTVLVVLVLIGMSITYKGMQTRVMKDRPLVLLHRPLNHTQASIGTGLMVHATARASSGIERVELWVDGAFVDSLEVAGEDPITPLVFYSDWIPETPGRHELIVRATSGKGMEGQASVEIEAGVAVSGDEESEVVAIVDVPPEGEAPAADDADESVGSSAPGGGPASDESPPGAEGNPPGAFLEIVNYVGLETLERRSSETMVLRAEVLSLETPSSYEALHCYVSLAGRPPAWYPDRDFDPSTDESFINLGGGSWDAAAELAGDKAIITPWPGDQSLPLSATCVGIRGGGSDSVELGRLALEIPPEHWDGVIRLAGSEGGEGGFSIEYRVNYQELEYLDLDETMAVPDPLWIDNRRQSLRWEYEPILEPEPQEPINGFLIFLNDTLVWTTHHSARESRLPEQWFHPPCGTEYVFTVRAYQQPYPEGPYSRASEPVVIRTGDPGDPGCDREYSITFSLLETGAIGGTTGPVFGGIFANDAGANFDGRCEGASRSDRCAEIHIQSNREYALSSWPWTSGYLLNRLAVTVPEDESLMIGFRVMDGDVGVNNIENIICAGQDTLSYLNLLSGEHFEGVLYSLYNGADGRARCKVHYAVEPIGGSPVGYGGSSIPLPWLDLEEIAVDRDTGELQFHVRNTGTAAWANHDLEIQGYRRSGGRFERVIFQEFYLEPGESAVLQSPETEYRQPLQYCWMLDPEDEVLERLEYTGTMFHGRHCPSLPDFTVTASDYHPTQDQLSITIQNEGNGAVEEALVDIRLDYNDGSKVLLPVNMDDLLTLGEWDSATLNFGPPAIDRDRLSGGYTLVIDPNDHYLEADEDNNTFTVRGSTRLRVAWNGAILRWYPNIWSEGGCGAFDGRGPVGQEITMSLRAIGPYTSRPITSWTLEHDVSGWPSGTDDLDFLEENAETGRYVVDFEIAGDESLSVAWSGEQRNDPLGSANLVYSPDEEWGSVLEASQGNWCYRSDEQEGGYIYPTENSWGTCGGWAVVYNICILR
jgi:hypothetical protein